MLAECAALTRSHAATRMNHPHSEKLDSAGHMMPEGLPDSEPDPSYAVHFWFTSQR